MSPICGLINTPNLNFFLSTSKLKSSRSRRVSQTTLHKTRSWMHTTRLNLLMQRFKLWLTNIKEYHAHNTCFKCKFKLNYSVQMPSQKEWFLIHTMVHSLKLRNQMQHSLSQGRAQCMLSPIGLPLFSSKHSFQLTQDQKGLFKSCNGDECKGMVI